MVIAMVVFFSTSMAMATLYVCKTPSGAVQFTNAPSSSTCEVYRKKKGTPITAVIERKKKGKKVTYSRSSYDKHIKQAGKRYSIDPYLIKAVIRVESDFNRYAVSKVGAQGLMQLMPATAKELRVSDPFDPRENIHGGTLYLRNLLNMFDGDLNLTLAAYNAGPTLVKRVKRIPRIPETVNYVKRVLMHYGNYSGKKISPSSSIKVQNLRIASSR